LFNSARIGASNHAARGWGSAPGIPGFVGGFSIVVFMSMLANESNESFAAEVEFGGFG
jgi:hypothetical protein